MTNYVTQDQLTQVLEEIRKGFNALYQGQSELKSELNSINSTLTEIDKRSVVVETKIDTTEKRLGTVEGKLPDVSEKFVELKNWRQIAFIIIAAVVGWFVFRWEILTTNRQIFLPT